MAIKILHGDCRAVLRTIPSKSVDCIVTSPPYFGLRSYGVGAENGEIGLEPSLQEYIDTMVRIFRSCRRVLKDDGTLWCNLGDSYAGSTKGGNPEAGSKQGTNKGSQSVGVLYGMSAEAKEAEARRISAGNAALYAAGLKQKDLIGVPWQLAFALRSDGWWLRSDIIYSKANPFPESITDRPTSAHEHVFLLSKSPRYYYDYLAIREDENVPDWDDGTRTFGGVNKHGANIKSGERTTGRIAGARKSRIKYVGEDGIEAEADAENGRNKRNVWTISTEPFPEAHFAVMPTKLIEPCIKAGCRPKGVVLDPFGGAGTVGMVADRLGRDALLIELNLDYIDIAAKRIRQDGGLYLDLSIENGLTREPMIDPSIPK